MCDMVFGQILCDPGYRVDFVVGTTYSVDLESFISFPFSLGFLEEPDEVMKRSPSCIFTAMKVCADSLAMFCNFSSMKVPSKDRKVFYALMEDSIFGINAGSKRNPVVNFHPKVWIIKETTHDGSSSRVKLIVMSRNLTCSNDLDVACEMTGEIGENYASKASQGKHQPLCDFLEYLAGKISPVNRAQKDKKKRIRALIDDILRVKSFDISGSIYDDYDFFPMGIPGHDGSQELEFISSCHETLVVSPFLDEKTVESFRSVRNPANRFLVTREDSVTEPMLDVFPQENIYTMNPGMTDIGDEDGTCVNLHAKMYFVTDKHVGYYQYLGSTNATGNGFSRNVEFLVRLRLAPYKYSFNSFREAFLDEKFSRFLKIVPPSVDKKEEYKLTERIRRCMSMLRDGSVSLNEDGTYDMVVNSAGEDASVTVHPLLCPEHPLPLVRQMRFRSIPLGYLSQFVVLTIEGEQQLAKVQIEMPEGRDQAICRRVMNANDFMDCIQFLLADNKEAYMVQKTVLDTMLSSGADSGRGLMPALYEDLLRSSYERPSVLDDIRKLTESVPDGIIDPAFREVFDSLVKSIKIARR